MLGTGLGGCWRLCGLNLVSIFPSIVVPDDSFWKWWRANVDVNVCRFAYNRPGTKYAAYFAGDETLY